MKTNLIIATVILAVLVFLVGRMVSAPSIVTGTYIAPSATRSAVVAPPATVAARKACNAQGLFALIGESTVSGREAFTEELRSWTPECRAEAMGMVVGCVSTVPEMLVSAAATPAEKQALTKAYANYEAACRALDRKQAEWKANREKAPSCNFPALKRSIVSQCCPRACANTTGESWGFDRTTLMVCGASVIQGQTACTTDDFPSGEEGKIFCICQLYNRGN